MDKVTERLQSLNESTELDKKMDKHIKELDKVKDNQALKDYYKRLWDVMQNYKADLGVK